MHRLALTLLALGTTGLVLPVFGLEPEAAPHLFPLVGLGLLAAGLSALFAAYRRDPTVAGDPRAWRRFRKNKGAIAGGVLVLMVGAIGFVGPILAPHDPDAIYDAGLTENGTPIEPGTVETEDGETLSFLVGTDNLGRDELSRLLYGGRVSLSVAMGAVAIAGTLGFLAGIFAGYFRGIIDGTIIQVINFVLSLPFLLVAIALNRVIDDPSLFTLCILLGLLSWTRLARVTRAKTLQVRELEYVQAARALGMGHGRILLRHVMPNVLGPAIVLVTTLIAQMIIIESAMSFLGLGVKPPTASWGTMLRDGQEYMVYAPRLLVWPAVLIVMTVFGFNLLGEGMRDALDPKE